MPTLNFTKQKPGKLNLGWLSQGNNIIDKACGSQASPRCDSTSSVILPPHKTDKKGSIAAV